jgi:hypothetical protein
MRTVAIPDCRSTPGNKGACALRRMEGDTAHFLMVPFRESEKAIRAFAGDDMSVAKYYDVEKDFLLELEPFLRCSVSPLFHALRDARQVNLTLLGEKSKAA